MKGGDELIATESPRTIGELWDDWARVHGIPLPLLEMYRRHGDRPGRICGTCDALVVSGCQGDDDCDSDSECSVCFRGLFNCLEHGGNAIWNRSWVACGAHHAEGEDDED